MRIVGLIRFHQAVILIDSGSTHNFVDTKLASALGIQPTGQDKIKVKIANGQEFASAGTGVRCTLHGLKQGVKLSWEGGDSFKLSKHEKKGLLL
jgi:hypothetical protein